MRTVIHVSANVTEEEKKVLRALALNRGKSARELAGEAVRTFLERAGVLKLKPLPEKNNARRKAA